MSRVWSTSFNAPDLWKVIEFKFTKWQNCWECHCQATWANFMHAATWVYCTLYLTQFRGDHVTAVRNQITACSRRLTNWWVQSLSGNIPPQVPTAEHMFCSALHQHWPGFNNHSLVIQVMHFCNFLQNITFKKTSPQKWCVIISILLLFGFDKSSNWLQHAIIHWLIENRKIISSFN